MHCLKKHFLSPANLSILEARDADAVKQLRSARTLHEFLVASSPFAVRSAKPRSRPRADDEGGNGAQPRENLECGCTFADLLRQSNPIDVAHRLAIPAIVVNAKDDPICTQQNVDDHKARMLHAGGKRCVLMEIPTGGHCAFAAGLRAERWFEKLAAGFLAEFASRASARR